MPENRRLNLDKIGALASAVCAVHCLLTGLALGLLSVAGLGILGSTATDAAFLAFAALLGVVAIWHGIRRHHSVKPALVFVLGLSFIVIGHFAFSHSHQPGDATPVERALSTSFSVMGGVCLVLFHVINLRLQRACGCDHCRTGR